MFYEYNRVNVLADWNSTEVKMADKKFKGNLLAKSYLCSQPEKGDNNNSKSNLKSNTIEDAAIPEQWNS